MAEFASTHQNTIIIAKYILYSRNKSRLTVRMELMRHISIIDSPSLILTICETFTVTIAFTLHLMFLPLFTSSYFNNTSTADLYSRSYIGWRKNCSSSQTQPETVLNLNQYIYDITDLQNELFYFHVVVLLSYVLMILIVKNKLVKERTDFLYILILEGIYILLCLIEVAISIVGVSKFKTFYTTCLTLKESNCSDPTTNMIFGYLNDTFYAFSLRFYFIGFFAMITCFLYPLNSTYIYLHTQKSDEAKELQQLVS